MFRNQNVGALFSLYNLAMTVEKDVNDKEENLLLTYWECQKCLSHSSCGQMG